LQGEKKQCKLREEGRTIEGKGAEHFIINTNTAVEKKGGNKKV